ncbi:MAG TPA: DUF1844 domain-containing protein, partial [Bryobacteraceae bacterium]
DFLIISLKTQAEAALGLIRFSEDPAEQPLEPNFRVARHAIDTLAMLQDKTKGNTNWDEERLLHNTLTELRFRFVQMHEIKKPGEVPPAESNTSSAAAAASAPSSAEGEAKS